MATESESITGLITGYYKQLVEVLDFDIKQLNDAQPADKAAQKLVSAQVTEFQTLRDGFAAKIPA
jgi:hypothetical protein